jgi:uncharacterized OB-fold protein
MKRPASLYDEPMWAGFAKRQLLLQQCEKCSAYRYPPASVCPQCLASAHRWSEADGKGTIITWAVFHRQYLPEYPAPYNVIAVQLAEGPLMASNLEGPAPEGSWIGRTVALAWADTPSGPLPRFRLA